MQGRVEERLLFSGQEIDTPTKINLCRCSMYVTTMYLRGCTCRRGLSGYFTTTTMTMTEIMGRLLRFTNAAARHLTEVLRATSTVRQTPRGRSGSARQCPSSTPDGPDVQPRTAGPRASAGARRLPLPGAVRAPQPSGLGRRRS